MNLRLPPKRFDDPNDPKYDSIRHHPWFRKVLKRREKLPSLDGARREVMDGVIQVDAAEHWGVDERELRDYCIFVNKSYQVDLETQVLHQRILNDAYRLYNHGRANTPFPSCIRTASAYFSANDRHVIEQWEVDPHFYPDGYLL